MSAEFTEGGGTAFPGLHEIGDVAYTTGGLTKREWFAGQAMQGLMAGYFTGIFMGDADREMVELRPDQMASIAAQAADALMKELQK